MRLRRPALLALGGGLALALLATSPAHAATLTWTSPGDSWWSTATWSGGAAPTTDDSVTFAGGNRSTFDYPGSTRFASFRFTNEHTLAHAGGAIELTGGVTVDPGAAVRIEPQLTASANQSWQVGAGAALTLPSQVYVSNTSTLTLQVDGTMTVTTGNVDGLATACIIKSGAGVLRLEGGGGGVGTCPGAPAGLNVTSGEVAIVGAPNLGGKDFAVTGGTFTGGTDAAAAVVHQLNLTGSGVVSPGASSGADIGMISLWGTSAWTGGTYQVDWDAAANEADTVAGAGQAISVADTRLDVRLSGTPTAGQSVRILGSDVAYSGQFAAPDGTALADGDEFTSNGQVYSVEYITAGATSGVLLHWERVAPAAPPVITPAAPALASTGAEAVVPFAAGALAVLGVGVALVAGRRRVRRAR